MNTRKGRILKAVIQTTFILCYIAFLSASINHVATFFSKFEPVGSSEIGSYMLAGAFDITALIMTIGAMFFRRSMPKPVLYILWLFIFSLAAYSFFMNWEYTAHFQDLTFTMQPTGVMLPIYKNGVLTYVPEMKENTLLTLINPIMASGFTIFALVYSVIAEFFGTKPLSIQELEAQRNYLRETEAVMKEIETLQTARRGKSIFETTREVITKTKAVINEVSQAEVETKAPVEAEAEVIKEVTEVETEAEKPTQNIVQFHSSRAKQNTKQKVDAYLSSLSRDEQVYFWNHQDEVATKFETSIKTVQRAFETTCPESKQKKRA